MFVKSVAFCGLVAATTVTAQEQQCVPVITDMMAAMTCSTVTDKTGCDANTSCEWFEMAGQGQCSIPNLMMCLMLTPDACAAEAKCEMKDVDATGGGDMGGGGMPGDGGAPGNGGCSPKDMQSVLGCMALKGTACSGDAKCSLMGDQCGTKDMLTCGMKPDEATCNAEQTCQWMSGDMGGGDMGGGDMGGGDMGGGDMGGGDQAGEDMSMTDMMPMMCKMMGADEAQCTGLGMCKWVAPGCEADPNAKCSQPTLKSLVTQYVKATSDNCYKDKVLTTTCSAGCKAALADNLAFGKKMETMMPQGDAAPTVEQMKQMMSLMQCMVEALGDLAKDGIDAEHVMSVMDTDEGEKFSTVTCAITEEEVKQNGAVVDADVAAAEAGKEVVAGSGGKTESDLNDMGAGARMFPSLFVAAALSAALALFL